MNPASGLNGKKHICIGLLAHVDAGKTTLAEALLYQSGQLRKPGRVDNRDAFLDTYDLERERGITIFSKQAQFQSGERIYTLLDTPGHVDFSAEMERALQVLDYGILVISGADGVQGHTRTLWQLLRRYQVPVFLFVNKMDQPGTDRTALLREMKECLDENCVDFTAAQPASQFAENVAVCAESLLEQYVEEGNVKASEIAAAIARRKIFPCYFGSALKLEGVDEFLEGLERYMLCPAYPETFGARVYKVARDDQGTRLTYMKITGGLLRVKTALENGEKANQIRIYSGARYDTVSQAEAGTICAVTGLKNIRSGQGLGAEAQSALPFLEPVLNYKVMFPDNCDTCHMLENLRQLEEEEPMLRVLWNGEAGEIHVQLMGQVQAEILKSLIQERFGVRVEFDEGAIVYRETIQNKVEGVGHYEPLRHYAEVHLTLEPGLQGSGLLFASECSEDMLDRNWQRLILSQLAEKEHAGVLTGSPVTDMKITLTAGRAHEKHTEGGDFRQAAFRALRQGLRRADCLLLEPYDQFTLEIPRESLGRAMTDIRKMSGTFTAPSMEGEMAVLTGFAPVATLRNYQAEVTAYTRGMGRLFCTLKGYEPCHNAEEVIAAIGYDPDRDPDNPADSIFCAHGAGFAVPWDEAEQYMHMPVTVPEDGREQEQKTAAFMEKRENFERERQNDKELEAIFERTYGPVKRRLRTYEPESGNSAGGTSRTESAAGTGPDGLEKNAGLEKQKTSSQMPGSSGAGEQKTVPVRAEKKEYLLVDGYNVIFSWEELNELAKTGLDAARTRLMDILSNYQGWKQCTVILVFDAYRVENSPGETVRYRNIYVVYTKEAETADQYIEKTVHKIGRSHHVTVATSDYLEQVIILGQGAHRISSRELQEEIIQANQEIRTCLEQRRQSGKNYLFQYLDEETAEYMERIRLGRLSPPGDGKKIL